MPLFLPSTERSRPLLGTYVRIRVDGLPPDLANSAIDAAFEAIGNIQRLMSFRENSSDVFQLNHSAHCAPVRVDARTYEVIKRAVAFSECGDGVFDVTVAPELVARRRLPLPEGAPTPSSDGNWRDIVFLGDDTIRFQKPLWIDLGGIAKGYAVDRAIDVLRTFSPARVCVNAGGDLRVAGVGSERVQLMPDDYDGAHAAFVEIENGSVASSCGRMTRRSGDDVEEGAHVDPREGLDEGVWRFVPVVAEDCVNADALTKIVMATGGDCTSTLARYGAYAQTYDLCHGWRTIGSLDESR